MNRIYSLLFVALAMIVVLGGTLYAQDADTLTRDQIEPQYKWNTADIYETEADWEADFVWIQENYGRFEEFEGTLADSPEALLAVLKFEEELGLRIEKLHLYSHLSNDLDLSDQHYTGLYGRIMQLLSEVGAAGAYVTPEILAIPEEKLAAFMDESEEIALYAQFFDDLLRSKDHVLPKEQEELLARVSPMNSVLMDTFTVFKDAEMPYPIVEDPDGDDFQISTGRYYAALYDSDRDFRERVYRGYYEPFADFENTFASLFNGNVKAAMFYATARKYDSTRAASLTPNNVPLSVYDNLVRTANENVAPLHRWCEMKQRVLGLDDMHAYDTYVTLFPAVDRPYTYEEGMELTLESLQPLGQDYVDGLNLAFDNRWIDVYETPGKRSGAYSSGTTTGVHPYVLLNWNGTQNDVFTLTHEMGHNMHSYFTSLNQPYVYADYSIFVAEVASITNEILLLDYLIENAETKEEKLALIETNLNNITTTFYRQTRFAEFEMRAHERIEAGEALTADTLTDMYVDMYQHYWGDSMTVDREEGYTWARIPHFYYRFYVYQYATSYAASQAIAAMIKEEGQPAIDRYLAFLKSGESQYPIDVLLEVGVDMNSPSSMVAVVEKMDDLLDQMEELLEEE